MAPEIIDLTCPGCGAPVSTQYKECDCCGRPLVIQTFKTLIDLDGPIAVKYVNEYRKILQQDPYNPEINKSMGLAQLKLGLYDDASNLLDKATVYCPNDSDALFFSSLPRLKGKKPVLAKRSEIDVMIQKINAAILVEPKAIYEYMLAVIKSDYFYKKGFNIQPDYNDHFERSLQLGLSDTDVDELDTILGIKTRDLFP